MGSLSPGPLRTTSPIDQCRGFEHSLDLATKTLPVGVQRVGRLIVAMCQPKDAAMEQGTVFAGS
jgi:hypothetical protein